ncbi:MAG: hypothetical protein HY445_03250, partial [Candidatus Niyogibacteria bacterium]|nr:hypothetical protein [Candidatus Niyogibacteria bacterium]
MENELKKNLTETKIDKKIDKLIKKNNLPIQLLDLLKKNMALIVNVNKKSSVIRPSDWRRDVRNETTFSFGEYFFEIVCEFHQYWDSREDDGTTAGWSTTQQKDTLIIKDKSG